jgi:hypothetical protein
VEEGYTLGTPGIRIQDYTVSQVIRPEGYASGPPRPIKEILSVLRKYLGSKNGSVILSLPHTNIHGIVID